MENGWNYFQQFEAGMLEAADKKINLRHAFTHLTHSPENGIVSCKTDAIPDKNSDKVLKREFPVTIKCVNKESGLFVTAHGRGIVETIHRHDKHIQMCLQVHIDSISAWQKHPDGHGGDVLLPLFDNSPVRQARKAKKISSYH
jgi:hypothetical protein